MKRRGLIATLGATVASLASGVRAGAAETKRRLRLEDMGRKAYATRWLCLYGMRQSTPQEANEMLFHLVVDTNIAVWNLLRQGATDIEISWVNDPEEWQRGYFWIVGTRHKDPSVRMCDHRINPPKA